MRPWLVAAPSIAGAVALIAVGPFGDLAHYHAFADGRAIWGVPNFWNVVSNLPFVAIGLAMLAAGPRRLEVALMGAALALTGFGSAWYHESPCDARLVWDRLPLMGFTMSWFALFLRERTGVRLLAPLLAFGLASVGVWAATGDVRLYVIAQYAPLATVPVVLALYPGRATGWTLAALLLYGVAKAFEMSDAHVWFGPLSGHTIKHFVAAGAAWALWRSAERRARDGAECVPYPARR